MLPLRFVPFDQLGSTPNVIVDGSPSAATVLTLSHWPGSPTPAELRDDLSAQIAFRALDHRALFDGVSVVSNNHFDQDGLASAYVLTHPAPALARRDLVVDLASAGDFGTFRSRDAARLAFTIAAYEDPDRSPLDPTVFEGTYGGVCGRLYEELLPRLTELLDHPERSRELWAAEDAQLTHGLEAIASGIVTIEERPAVDLAIVRVPESWPEQATTRFTEARAAALHPMAVHRSTARLRIATLQGRRYSVECRYETWVALTSRTVLPRPDLRDLVPLLDAAEPDGARWHADGPGSLTPTLQLVGEAESGLTPDEFCRLLEQFLASAPAAWDPLVRT